jgi:hypothetical protein
MFDGAVMWGGGELNYEHVSAWTLLSGSLALLWKPVRKGPAPEGLVAFGYASVSPLISMREELAVTGPIQSYDLESTGGPRLAARIGVTEQSGFGVGLTVWGAYLFGEHAKYVPIGFAFQVILTSW